MHPVCKKSDKIFPKFKLIYVMLLTNPKYGTTLCRFTELLGCSVTINWNFGSELDRVLVRHWSRSFSQPMTWRIEIEFTSIFKFKGSRIVLLSKVSDIDAISVTQLFWCKTITITHNPYLPTPCLLVLAYKKTRHDVMFITLIISPDDVSTTSNTLE